MRNRNFQEEIKVDNDANQVQTAVAGAKGEETKEGEGEKKDKLGSVVKSWKNNLFSKFNEAMSGLNKLEDRMKKNHDKEDKKE